MPPATRAARPAVHSAAGLDRTGGQDPGDRNRLEPDREGAQRRQGAAIGPLQVVETHQHRPSRRRALQQRLQILHQPIPLLGTATYGRQRGALEQRRRPVEQRPQQRRELDDGLGRVGLAQANPYLPPTRHPHRLREQAALPRSPACPRSRRPRPSPSAGSSAPRAARPAPDPARTAPWPQSSPYPESLARLAHTPARRITRSCGAPAPPRRDARASWTPPTNAQGAPP